MFILFFLFNFFITDLGAQGFMEKRSSFYGFTGGTSSKIRQLNELLEKNNFPLLQDQYRTLGLGYQARVNDFVLGFELSNHQSSPVEVSNLDLRYRTSRALLNVGYSLTEEGRFQLIHYMSLGMGYLNFEMLPRGDNKNLEEFLKNPEQGIVLRKNDIQKGTSNFGDFLTEIGFQLSYDFDFPGRKEALMVIAKAGYSFSPFEGSWSLNGIAFDNAQSGAFLRLGAGISLPDRNFFYKDASIGVSLIRGIHFRSPEKLNKILSEKGYDSFEGKPSNWGVRILGETDGLLYGVDVYNLSLDGRASNSQDQSLNSLRIYATGGLKFFQLKNFALGALAGLGYGNLRYSILTKNKPDFPALFEQRYFDGYLKSSGMMAKPEIMLEYSLPMTERKFFELVFSGSAGYEMAFPGYKLGNSTMNNYLSGPYLIFGIGIRP
jgi:hypothetical protein